MTIPDPDIPADKRINGVDYNCHIPVNTPQWIKTTADIFTVIYIFSTYLFIFLIIGIILQACGVVRWFNLPEIINGSHLLVTAILIGGSLSVIVRSMDYLYHKERSK
jgi:hypothetical protein